MPQSVARNEGLVNSRALSWVWPTHSKPRAAPTPPAWSSTLPLCSASRLSEGVTHTERLSVGDHYQGVSP